MPRRIGIVLVVLMGIGMALFGVVRAVAAPGDLDPSFSKDGRATLWVKKGAFAMDAYSMPQDKLLIVGCTDDFCGDHPIILARLKPNGRPDSSFSREEYVLVRPFPDGFVSRISTAVQQDGKILIAGSPELGEMAVARFNADGSPDLSFGVSGIATTHEPRVTATSVAVGPAGTVVVAGTRLETDGTDPLGDDLAIARFRPDGAVVPNASGGEVQVVNLGRSEWASDVVFDGTSLVLAGTSVAIGSPGGYDFFAARFDSEGEPDGNFGEGGAALADLGGAESAVAIAVDSLGRLVLAGTSTIANPETTYRYAVARLEPNGSLDESFSEDGGLVGSFAADAQWSIGRDIALRPDGGMLLVGDYNPADAPFDAISILDDFTQVGAALIREDGELVPEFGDSGAVAASFRPIMTADAAVVTPAGTLYAVGDAYYRRLAVLRFLTSAGHPDADADGHLDAKDGCPRRFGRRHHGCPRNERGIWFHYSNLFSGLAGRVISNEYACSFNRRVTIFETRPGPDRRLAIRTSSDEDGFFKLRWPQKRDGTYYAVTPRVANPSFGICPAARSDPVKR